MSNLSPLPLPDGIRSTYVNCTASCGLNFHYLEAGYSPLGPTATRRKPLLLMLHGYPEIAYSWRKVLVPLAGSTYHAVAVDQRGYGRTTGWDNRSYHDVDLKTFKFTQVLADLVCFVNALGHTRVHCLIGHDFGAFVTGLAAMARPDFFRSAILMSHPFKGSPTVPFNIAQPTSSEKEEQQRAKDERAKSVDPNVFDNLAKLNPPRKHYSKYNSSPEAADEWYCGGDNAKLTRFLRGYVHFKSADWKYNQPHSLKGWNAEQLSTVPHYYVMKADKSMPETVEEDMQGEDYNTTKRWLPDDELNVYVQEWKRTGFQGGLNWYRSNTHPTLNRELNLWAGRKIDCPCAIINGKKDWGKFQRPGEMDNFEEKYSDFRGAFDVRAGHWPQQEDPESVIRLIQEFLRSL